ncbi:hypothetical protein RBB50_008992 [Rhinocladiella similis]
MSSPYALNTKHTIQARSGAAVPVSKGQTITVFNTHGTQVVDFWGFTMPTSGSTLPTWTSMSHTRATLTRLTPVEGDTLMSSTRLPVLKMIKDTTPGIHDTLMAACDRERYHLLGVPRDQYHESCTDNLHNAIAKDTPYQLPEHMTAPQPLNLFMNIPVVPLDPSQARAADNRTAGADLQFARPVGPKGGSVTFEALVDCVCVMSACPQDILKINDQNPTEAHFIVEG